MTFLSRPLPDRFAEKYTPEPNSGCWLWLGAVDLKGYGRIWDGASRPRPATHISLELAGNERPFADAMALHHCDVPGCVNPDHLYWGTALNNVEDKIKRGRTRYDKVRKTHCKRGHAYVEDNIYYPPKGPRMCRECMRHRDRLRRKPGGSRARI